MPYVKPTSQIVEPTLLPNPLGIYSQFCYNYPVTLVIGKVKAGLDTVRDLSGQDVLCITRSRWGHRIRFSTTDDQYLFELAAKALSSHWYLTDSTGEKYLVVKYRTKHSVQFKNTAGDGCDTTLQRNGKDEITCNGIQIAKGRLCGSPYAKGPMTAQYHVEVAPNVDLSMMAAMFIVLNDRSRITPSGYVGI